MGSSASTPLTATVSNSSSILIPPISANTPSSSSAMASAIIPTSPSDMMSDISPALQATGAATAATPIYKLPVEMIERVAQLAHPADLLALQLVSKHIAAATRSAYISAHFKHRCVLAYSEASVEQEISITRHPEFGRSLKVLSLLTDCPHSLKDTLDIIPTLSSLFTQLRVQASGLHLIITNRLESDRLPTGKGRRDWLTWHSYGGHKDSHGGIQQAMEKAGFCAKSFAIMNGTEDYYTSHLARNGLEAWKSALSSVERLSLGNEGPHYFDMLNCNQLRLQHHTLAGLPHLQSLQLVRSSFDTLGARSHGTYTPYCFPKLKRLRLCHWTTDVEDMVVFLKQQPMIEQIDLGNTQWAAGLGKGLARLAIRGEHLEGLLKRLTGVKNVSAGPDEAQWVARVIKARLG